MLCFNNQLDTFVKNDEIQKRAAELNQPLAPINEGSSSALFLQRWCLQAAYPQGQFANEWFYVSNQLVNLFALLEKLEQDADAENVPRTFHDEGEFCMLFLRALR